MENYDRSFYYYTGNNDSVNGITVFKPRHVKQMEKVVNMIFLHATTIEIQRLVKLHSIQQLNSDIFILCTIIKMASYLSHARKVYLFLQNITNIVLHKYFLLVVGTGLPRLLNIQIPGEQQLQNPLVLSVPVWSHCWVESSSRTFLVVDPIWYKFI